VQLLLLQLMTAGGYDGDDDDDPGPALLQL